VQDFLDAFNTKTIFDSPENEKFRRKGKKMQSNSRGNEIETVGPSVNLFQSVANFIVF
jgi:hypothetical protein